MPFTPQPLRILLITQDNEWSNLIRGVLQESSTPALQVEYASNGWDAQRRVADGSYDGAVLDQGLGDINCETLVSRLRALGMRAPALLLTSDGLYEAALGCDMALPKTDALTGKALVRAILTMIGQHDLNLQLAAALDQLARSTTAMTKLTHDLATPLGVIMGLTQLLVGDDETGLSADGRLCLEDVAESAVAACELLKRLSPGEPVGGRVSLPSAPAPDRSHAARSGPGSKLVLIADDDPATRRLVCAALVSDQYCVLQAADGEEAWRLIREHRPAVAILDWQMPVYSGLELTDVIKSDPQVSTTTVIMLTGRSTQADRDAGARARADLYLVKPFSSQELLGAVRQGLHIN